jgi:hypothetical protein
MAHPLPGRSRCSLVADLHAEAAQLAVSLGGLRIVSPFTRRFQDNEPINGAVADFRV